jgi:Rrf2 family protein
MISNKCHYALKALLELACREGRGPATITDIADAQQIPARFLEAILRQLKQAGLTDSVRGKHGGYILARPARDISVSAVVQLLEGSATDQGGTADVFAPIWQEAQSALNTVYERANFADLADAHKQASRFFVPDYVI